MDDRPPKSAARVGEITITRVDREIRVLKRIVFLKNGYTGRKFVKKAHGLTPSYIFCVLKFALHGLLGCCHTVIAARET